jgi:hypothetical protein
MDAAAEHAPSDSRDALAVRPLTGRPDPESAHPLPVGPMPVDPNVPAAREIDDPRADLRLEWRLDLLVGRPGRLGVIGDLRTYAGRRLNEALGDVAAIDVEIAALGARRRQAMRLARRYRDVISPRVDPFHSTRRAGAWYGLGRPTPTDAVQLLTGRALRDACVEVVLEADDALSVPEVRAALIGRGLDAAPKGRGRSPWNKAVADALADAVRAGHLRRRCRGIYEPAGGPRRVVPPWLEREVAFRRRLREQRIVEQPRRDQPRERSAAEADRPAS